MSVRELIEDYGYEDVLIFDNPDYGKAFIGVSTDNRAIFDYDLMIEYLMEECEIGFEDAIDFIEYNTIRSLSYYPNAPIVVNRLYGLEDE